MNDYLKLFEVYLKVEKEFSEHTVRNYMKDVIQLFDSQGIQSPTDITETEILLFFSKIMNLSNATRRRKLASIKKFCFFMKKKGLMSTNPAIDIETPKEHNKLPDVVSSDEVIRIINSVKRPKDRAIVQTLYGTGLRVSELVNIKLSDINFATRQIKVFGKGSKDRYVPFGENTLEALRIHLETRKVPSEYLFEGRYENTHMTERSARERVYIVTNSKLHPHSFRHCFATHMHQNGADILHLQFLLGHEDVSTTQIYTKIANNEANNVYHATHPMG